MTETTILYRNEYAKIVQLSAEYHPDYDISVRQTTACFSNNEVELAQMANRGKSRRFSLTDEETDALCTAWMAHRADQQAKAEAEEKRQQDILDEALALAATCPILTITERSGNGGMAWHLNADKLGVSFFYDAYTPAQLMEQVKEVMAHWEPYAESKKITNVCPYIRVKKDGSGWFVSIPDPALCGEWAYTTTELLKTVKRAQACYQEHMGTAQKEQPTLAHPFADID